MTNSTPVESGESRRELEIDSEIQAFGQEIVPSVCIWHDICGWGSVLRESDWDLSILAKSPKTMILRSFYQVAGNPSIIDASPKKSERVLIINDGIAKALDIDPIHPPSLIQIAFYLRDLVLHHSQLLRLLKNWDVSIRTVAAGGARMQYGLSTKTGQSYLYSGEKISSFGADILKQTFVYYPEEFQMNTAFSRAYTIESGGSKHGIPVGGLFFESDFMRRIKELHPENIVFADDRFEVLNEQGVLISFHFSGVQPFQSQGMNCDVFRVGSCQVTERLENEPYLFDLS